MTQSAFTIQVPRSDWDGRAADMRSRLVTWEWRWKLPAAASTLELDFSSVDFMEPWALVLFAAYGLEMRRRGLEVRGRFSDSNPANRYLVSMGLGEALETGASTITSREWSTSHQSTGLHVFRTYDDLKAFRRSTSSLTLEHCEEAADALFYVLNELGRNVLQHSGSPIGGVAIAQHFPETRRLQLAVCDLGQGIRRSLAPRHPELRTDLEGLRLAVLPHASGAAPAGPYGGAENVGLGLFYAREIAWRAGGSFWLGSGSGLLGIRGDRQSLWEQSRPAPDRVYRRIESWPGTVVAIDFPVDGIPDFSGILEICSGLAEEARRLAGPAGLDFVGTAAEFEDAFIVGVADFAEDNERAVAVRDRDILPRVQRGESVLLDFRGVRAPTQSFVHALLAPVFQVPGSLVRVSFANCTGSAREILRAVAAYASYRRIV